MSQFTPENEERMFAIRLGKVNCCIELSSIVRTTSLVELQPIPGSPPFLKGIMDFAGNNLLVLDLAERLSLSDLNPYTLDTSIVICQFEDNMGAFIVDELLGIINVQTDGDRHEAAFDCHNKLPFKGVLSTEHGLALWLDVDSAVRVLFSETISDCKDEVEALLETSITAAQ